MADTTDIRSILLLADEACRVAAEAGLPVRAVNAAFHEYTGSGGVTLHPEDQTQGAALAFELGLTGHATFSVNRGTGEVPVDHFHGQWAGINLVILSDAPVPAESAS